MNFAGVTIKGVRPPSSCVSKSHLDLADVSSGEVFAICVGLSYKNEVFYLFLGVFPESEVSEVFLRVWIPWCDAIKVFQSLCPDLRDL